MYAHLFGHVFMWTTGFLGIYAACLQIYENYRLKTTSGLGIYKIWIGSTFLLLQIPGIYLLPVLAFPRKILFPLGYIATLTILYQDFAYNPAPKRRRHFYQLYSLSLIILLSALVISIVIGPPSYRLISMTGMFGLTVACIPQIIRIYQQKTTYGLSKAAVVINLFLFIISIVVSAMIFKEDWIHTFNGLRKIAIQLILLFQVLYFDDKKPGKDKANIW